MSTVEEIERAIPGAFPEKLAELRAWFAVYDSEVWDREFVDDVQHGRLNRLADEALNALDRGDCPAVMNHLATPGFWLCYRRLPEPVRRLADSCFALLHDDPRHPSLHFRRVGRFWSVRVGLHYRALAVQRTRPWCGSGSARTPSTTGWCVAVKLVRWAIVACDAQPTIGLIPRPMPRRCGDALRFYSYGDAMLIL